MLQRDSKVMGHFHLKTHLKCFFLLFTTELPCISEGQCPVQWTYALNKRLWFIIILKSGCQHWQCGHLKACLKGYLLEIG